MKFQFDNKQFQIQDNQISVDGDCLTMSAKGHACLILFIQSEQATISKEQLMKTLWDQVIVSDDSLFKVIQEVRQSLRDLGIERDMIGNVYGKGYKWLAQSEKTIPKKRAWYWPAALILLCLVGFLMVKKPPATKITATEFTQLKQQLKTGNPIDLTSLTESKELHPEDSMRMAYLKGYQLYQRGAYDQSILTLQTGIEKYSESVITMAQADAYLLLAKIFIYRDNKAALQAYLNEAENLYQQLQHTPGLMDTRIERARYHQTLFEYEKSITQLQNILKTAEANDDPKNQMRSWGNLAYAYEQTQQPQAEINALEQSLELALSLGDGGYAAYAYGALSDSALKAQDHQQAMKHAQAALQFVLAQHDTNQFQQGFSAFYLLLLPFGHDDLAQKYLDQAIEIQRLFNAEGVLFEAEFQRIELRTQQQQYTKNREQLKLLMQKKLDQSNFQELEALLAYNSHFLQDNINAYTRAKPIFDDPSSTRTAKLYAGMALVLAADQLERPEEALATYQSLTELISPNDNIIYTAYLDMSTHLPDNWVDQNLLNQQLSTFKQRQAHTKSITKPKPELLQSLDAYIKNITQNHPRK